MNPAQVAHRIISNNRYMTLATNGVNDIGESAPWVSAVAYAYDTDCRFYWYSAVDAVHSRNIASNPKVAAAIFNSTESSDVVDGLQLVCVAHEVLSQVLDAVMQLYWEQSFPVQADRDKWMRPRSDFEGLAPQRFYVAEVQRVYKIDTSISWIDRRQQIDLAEICRLLQQSG